MENNQQNSIMSGTEIKPGFKVFLALSDPCYEELIQFTAVTNDPLETKEYPGPYETLRRSKCDKWNGLVRLSQSMQLQIYNGDDLIDTLNLGKLSSLPIDGVKFFVGEHGFMMKILIIPENNYGLKGFVYSKCPDNEFYKIRTICVNKDKLGLYSTIYESEN